MIVDDEKGIREALKQVLEYEEIEVQASASGLRRFAPIPTPSRTSCFST
jgi:CheY-like chemotaxis protein